MVNSKMAIGNRWPGIANLMCTDGGIASAGLIQLRFCEPMMEMVIFSPLSVFLCPISFVHFGMRLNGRSATISIGPWHLSTFLSDSARQF